MKETRGLNKQKAVFTREKMQCVKASSLKMTHWLMKLQSQNQWRSFVDRQGHSKISIEM